MDTLHVRPLLPADAEVIASWRYDGPWAVYNSATPVSADDGYAVVVDDHDRLIGFFCTGAEARVPGLEEVDGVLDIGLGMAPDLVGQGHGREFAARVLGALARTSSAREVRAVVQAWNARSRRLARGMGFEEVGVHTCRQDGADVQYTVLMRDLPR